MPALILAAAAALFAARDAFAQQLNGKEQRILLDCSGIDLMLIATSEKPAWEIATIHPQIDRRPIANSSGASSLFAYSLRKSARVGSLSIAAPLSGAPEAVVDYRFDDSSSNSDSDPDPRRSIDDPFLSGGAILMPITVASKMENAPFPLYCIEPEWTDDLQCAIDSMRASLEKQKDADAVDSQENCLRLLESPNIFLQNFAVQRLGTLLSGDATGVWSPTSLGNSSVFAYESDSDAHCLPGAIKIALARCIIEQRGLKQAVLTNTLISTMTDASKGEIEDILSLVSRQCEYAEQVCGCLTALKYFQSRPAAGCADFDPAAYIAEMENKQSAVKNAKSASRPEQSPETPAFPAKHPPAGRMQKSAMKTKSNS